MATYTKTTNFTAKDNLTSGDPAKVIKGSEFDTEFNSIETAVNSKANANNGTHTGTTTISTANIDTLQIDSVSVTATAAELNTLDGITATTAELNTTDGLTATTAELNTLDGITSTTAELNLLDGVTATTTELNILDGVTSTTAEINKLDGFTGTVDDLNYAKDLRATGVTTAEFDKLDGLTATTAELNITDGLTATTAELNVLDGITATTTELNYTDGVTSNIQTQLDSKAPTASPTFTGTTTIPTVDINGGNIDGAVIGSSEAASGQFTTLVSNSAIIGGELDVAGTVSADGLTVDGSTTTGINGSNYTYSGTNYEVHTLVGTTGGGVRLGQDSVTRNGFIGTTGVGHLDIVTYNGSAWNKRVKFQNNGNVEFYEDTGTTAKMVWDASAEMLTVPDLGLALSDTNSTGLVGRADRAYIELERSDFDGKINFYTTTSGSGGITNRMTISDTGNVGIGTGSPSSKLTVNGDISYPWTNSGTYKLGVASRSSNIFATNTSTLEIHGADATTGSQAMAGGDVKIRGGKGYGTAAGSAGNVYIEAGSRVADFSVDPGKIIFNTGTSPTERARIDSSGNLLVGTTSVTPATSNVNGVALKSGVSQISNASDSALRLNRGSNGDILEFRKNGAVLGAVNTVNDNLHLDADRELRLQSNRGRLTQVYLGDGGSTTESQFFPLTSNVDLGRTANNWRDLYLSGGVYLGGTGSANKLDDYEEGTWTPTLGNFSSGAGSVETARYTKIGRIVHICLSVDVTTATSTGNQSFTFTVPFSQYTTQCKNIGTVSTYNDGNRTSGIVINNSSGNTTEFFAGFNLASVKGVGERIDVSLTYETTS